MKKLGWGILVGMLILPAASARAGNLCPAGASAESRYCSISSPMVAASSGTPYFAVNRGVAPVLGMDLFSFNASFTGKFGGVSSLVETAGSGKPSSRPGRQGIGNGGNGGGTFGRGGLFGSAPDGWFRNTGSSTWNNQSTWTSGYSGYTGDNDADDQDDGGGLTTTPEPFTLILFGTGLLLIAFLARRVGTVREDV